jgi:hypothetical protein
MIAAESTSDAAVVEKKAVGEVKKPILHCM